MKKSEPFEFHYPTSHRLTSDVGRIGRSKHLITGLIEVDVTEARKKLRQVRSGDRNVSFLAWFIKTVADTVSLHPLVNGVMGRGDRVLAFKDINISIVAEKMFKGMRVPLASVIRHANIKTADQITKEIQMIKDQDVQDGSEYVLGKKSGGMIYNTWLMELFVRLPQWLRVMLMRLFILGNPARMQEVMGTVMISSLGMGGHARGWFIPRSLHSLSLSIGSLNEQPAIYKGEIQKREILHLTILVDHDVVDGVPIAAFVEQLVRRFEEGYEL
ncbi:MAG: 2-oxo acid dehydrogenase subunit E2 [Anaerolineaceae bacterium]